MMPAILHYPSRDEQAADLAEIVARELSEAIEENGKATLAVPGGSTPGAFLRALARERLDWAKLRVMLTDERFVPETSPRSNTRLLRENLLQGPAEQAILIPFTAPADAPEDVIDRLSAAVEAALPLDVCVLGMGEDMHTASLFPGADRLDDALAPGAPALMAMRAPGAPEPRITLTAPVLRGARILHLLLAGKAKQAPLEQAMQSGPVVEAPVRAILTAPVPVTVHYAD